MFTRHPTDAATSRPPRPRPEPIRLPPDGLPATLYRPIHPRPGTEAWLLAPPPGDDRKGACLPLARLSRALAARGDWALMFDWRGCGEGPGEFDDADWEGWLDDFDHALEGLRSLSGQEAVVAWGGRVGARLVAEACLRAPGRVTRLVFWDALHDAEAWWTEWRRRSRFRLGAPAEALPEEDLDGYVAGMMLRRQLAERREVPARPSGVSVRFLQMTPSGKVPSSAVVWATAWGAAVEPVTLQPFWLAGDPAAATALVDATLDNPEKENDP